MCLGVPCHLLFWQNDRGLLHATAATRGCNGHRIKSQHTKLTLEKKILPPLLPGFELATFRSQVRRCNQRAIPAPMLILCTLSKLGTQEKCDWSREYTYTGCWAWLRWTAERTWWWRWWPCTGRARSPPTSRHVKSSGCCLPESAARCCEPAARPPSTERRRDGGRRRHTWCASPCPPPRPDAEAWRWSRRYPAVRPPPATTLQRQPATTVPTWIQQGCARRVTRKREWDKEKSNGQTVPIRNNADIVITSQSLNKHTHSPVYNTKQHEQQQHKLCEHRKYSNHQKYNIKRNKVDIIICTDRLLKSLEITLAVYICNKPTYQSACLPIYIS